MAVQKDPPKGVKPAQGYFSSGLVYPHEIRPGVLPVLPSTRTPTAAHEKRLFCDRLVLDLGYWLP